MKTIFQNAYQLIKKGEIIFDFKTNTGIYYLIKNYPFNIYLKTALWLSQCGCRVGVSNKPNALCKHSICGIVTHFLRENKLRLVDDER